MARSVLAIAAHPDDIEFVMAGTLMRLHDLGWNVHYFNIANGCCGSMELSRADTAAKRTAEAQNAAAHLNANFYSPICNDVEVFYDRPLHQKVAAVVRRAKPQIILTHSLTDYMEDHQNAARLAVGAAFVRAMPNFEPDPYEPPYAEEVAVYHAQPHGNRDPMGGLIEPKLCVDITSVIERKEAMLAEHVSQATWLDQTQGMGSYITTMKDLSREVGAMSGKFDYAEGWRPHLHLGLAASKQFDPLSEALLPEHLLMR